MTVPSRLVESGEVEFDRALDAMSMKELVETISHIQSEIVREQNKFQSLHHQLNAMYDVRSADDTAAYRRISQELVECQDRMGMFVQKNIKCFKSASTKDTGQDETDSATTSPAASTRTTASKVDASAKTPTVDSIPTGGTVKTLRSTVWHQETPPLRPQAASTLTTRRSQNCMNGDFSVNNHSASENGPITSTRVLTMPKLGNLGNGPSSEYGINDNGTMHYIEHRQVTDISAACGDPGDDELVTSFEERPSLLKWNPAPLLDDLYRIDMDASSQDDLSRHYVIMEGYLEKLPMNTQDTSVLKVWKRRYCKADRGNLFYYKEKHDSKSLGFIQLMGSVVTDGGQRTLKIDDQRGHLLTLRCTSDREHSDWLVALQSQTIDDTPRGYIRPVKNPEPHPNRKVVIIDLGGASVRAGILGNMPSLPDVFFPFVVAVDKVTGELVYGQDAYKPEIRTRSKLIHPLKPSVRFDKVDLSGALLTGLVDKVFAMLDINPSLYTVMLSTASLLTSSSLQEVVTSLFDVHKVQAVCMMYQSVLALYSYGSTQGVVMDLGERCDIVPVIDGYVMYGCSNKQPYGGSTVSERLSLNLAEHKHRFYTDTEKLFTRLTKEKYCYVSKNHDADMDNFYLDKSAYHKTIPLSHYHLPANAFSEITVDSGTFHAAEGLFEPGHWGQDTLPVHKATFRVIQQCPVDARKHLCRNIYLSGGTSLLRGFAERLHAELQMLFKSQSVQVQVHASPYRYHAAYIGACVLAALDDFPSACVLPEQWREDPATCIRKLQAI